MPFIMNYVPCTSFYLIKKYQENIFFEGYLVILVLKQLGGNTEM